jgi:enoyl-CoA hydratase
MTGEKIPTDEAANLGIVDHVHPPDELASAVDEFAKTLASKPPLAVRSLKNAINATEEMSLESGRQYEHRVARALLATEDHERAIETFGEDETAEFQGK